MKSFPFPFFGAGYGHYYEWAEVVIRFIDKPSKDQEGKIIKLAPPPIRPEENSFEGRMLTAGSEQFVHMYIQEAYDDPTVIEKMNEELAENEDWDYVDDEVLFYASKKALDAFERDIERWLLEIHQFCPIEFAYRMEDCEAGCTEFSAWHYNSLEAIPALIQKWQEDPKTFQQETEEKDLFEFCLSGIFNFGQVDYDAVPETIIDYLFQETKLTRLFDKSDLTEALAYYQQHKNDEDVTRIVKQILTKFNREKQYAKINQLTEAILDTVTQDYSLMLAAAGEIVYAALMEDNQPLIDRLVQQLSHQNRRSWSISKDSASSNYANNIAVVAYSMQTSNPVQARRMYEIALDIQIPEPTEERLELYCNALWVLQKDNTGLPVDAALNEKFMDKCLPYGPKNPAVFFNAACLYVEMEEFDKAVECVRQAIAHEYDGIQMMKDQILSEGMFAEFRKYPPLVEALNL